MGIMAKRQDRLKDITRQRRQQLLEAALHVFSQKGFDKSTIPDIAKGAGVAVGTIYNYYPNKRELFVAAIAKFIIEPFTAVIKRTPQNGDADYISTIVENRLNIGLENVGHFITLFSDIQRDPELRQRYSEQVLQPVFGMMENYYTSRIEGGVFRNINPTIITRAIGGMVIGFMLLYRIEGESSPVHGIDRKALADELTKLILHGLQKT
jgi:AcrR family transcriptional regulator